MPQPIIYISGPMSGNHEDEVMGNVNIAIDLYDKLVSQGHICYLPHLTYYCNERHPHDWNFWIDMDKAWLSHCSYLVRIPGYSPGADIEVEEAQKLGIQVILLENLPDPFLLPCPHCGGIAELYMYKIVGCPKCQYCLHYHHNVVDWNRRT